MEENCQKIRPSRWFTVQLFLFMMAIFLLAIGQFTSLPVFMNDTINPIETKVLLFSVIIDILVYSYAFLSIYKALQGKPYCISMLRLSVFYIFVQFIFKMREMMGSGSLFHSYMFLLPAIFFILFLVYLLKSKHLNTYVPKTKREFGIWGCIGLLLYVMVFIMYAYVFGGELIKRSNSLPMELSSVVIKEGETTDGLTAFMPLKTWLVDTVVIGNVKDGFVHSYHSEHNQDIHVTSLIADCNTKIHYYLLLNRLKPNQLSDSVRLKEMAYKDSVINGNRYYLNTYSFINDGDTAYWTFSALMETGTFKIITFSSVEYESYRHSIEMSDEFMKQVRFELEQRRIVNQSINEIYNSSNNHHFKN